jgi:hypothetical protein
MIAVKVTNKEQANKVIDYFEKVGKFPKAQDREIGNFNDLCISGEETILECNWAFGDESIYKYCGYNIISFSEFESEYLISRSLCKLTEKEYLADKKFRDKHFQKCENGGRFIYELIETGIGTIIKVGCPICGKGKDITDMKNW